MTGVQTCALPIFEVSDIPFEGPIAGVKVGRVNGQYVANPTADQLEESDIEIVVAASRDAVIMVEGSASMVSEEDMLEAIFFGHAAVQSLIDAQIDLRQKAGVPKRDVLAPVVDEALTARVRELAHGKVKEAVRIKSKVERHAAIGQIMTQLLAELGTEYEGRQKEIKGQIGRAHV